MSLGEVVHRVTIHPTIPFDLDYLATIIAAQDDATVTEFITELIRRHKPDSKPNPDEFGGRLFGENSD